MVETRRATAHDILSAVKASARREMDRSTIGLFFSGLSGGLNISFGFMAVAAAEALVPDRWKTLIAAAVYPVGFLLVILGRAQLFTENTLTPVVLLLEKPDRRTLLATGRIWGVVLLANLLGAFLIAVLLASVRIGTRLEPAALLDVALASVSGGWLSLFMRGVFAAWLVALLVWMLHAGASPTGEAVLIWLTTALIYFAGFAHSIAGAVEGLYLANVQVITYLDWLWGFQLPVTLGNAAGGVVFVAIVNWAQAVGAGRDAEIAERQRVVERVQQVVVEKQAEHAARTLLQERDPEQVEEKLDNRDEGAQRIVRQALDRDDEERQEDEE